MLNRMLLVLAIVLLSACGGGGGGGSSGDAWVVGWQGVLDLVSQDLSGATRTKPGAMGALEAN